MVDWPPLPRGYARPAPIFPQTAFSLRTAECQSLRPPPLGVSDNGARISKKFFVCGDFPVRKSPKFPGSEPRKSIYCGESAITLLYVDQICYSTCRVVSLSTGSTRLGAAERSATACGAFFCARPRPRGPRLGAAVHLRRAPGSRSKPVLGRYGPAVAKRDGAEVDSFTDDRPGRVHHLQRQPEQSARQERGEQFRPRLG